MSLPKFLAVDPGEDTGWSVWTPAGEVVDCGTTKMWEFSDAVWAVALEEHGDHGLAYEMLPEDLAEIANSIRDIGLLVLENWTLYPWEAMKGSLNWDECRTARLIGSLFAATRVAGWDYEQQPAKIKDRAKAAGAEAFFEHPLHENRHANDSKMHGVFRLALDHGAAWTDMSQKDWMAEG